MENNTAVAEGYSAQDTTQNVVNAPQNSQMNELPLPNPQEQINDWKNAFSPEYKQALDRYKNADDLIKTTLSAQALLGKRNKDWQAEDAESYKAIMGESNYIPADANEYNIDVGQSSLTDENAVNIVKHASKMMGLNKDQAQQLYDLCADMYQTDLEAKTEEAEEAMVHCGEVLSQLWGKDYPNQLKAVELCAEQVFPKITGMSVEQITNLLEQTNSIQNPLLLAAMSYIGNSMMESGTPGYYGTSPMDARIDLEAMQNDKELMGKMLNVWDPKSALLRKEFLNRIEEKNKMM